MATENLSVMDRIEERALRPRERVFAARVMAVIERGVVVMHEHEAGTCTSLARRAASCLLAPRATDTVLCAAAGDALYVLAVLERAGDATEIEVEGDLAIRARGSVDVAAAQDLSLSATGTARVRATAMAWIAEEASWIGRELRMLGEQVTLDAAHIRQVSTFAERVAESAKETLGRSYRHVRESEHVQAGALTFSLRTMLRCHAETAVMTAKKLIKLDGEQIHLG